ncbi:hypothetical protein [Caulobacter hibisci]|uniref:Uncharacterized protein n=1 Tax=Caulobacter hibisci TaxID=2035993 RepID=A0ABS0SYZ7_9CAUL|nr:hypothetical protein [Caulobacter hibisci]MBI1684774.1 hypothetical protein [Caulobacter hibisci]
MLLSAMLLAAAVQAAPVTPAAAPSAKPVEGRVVYPARRNCPMGEVSFTLERKEPAVQAQPLAKEPRAKGRYAVMRMIDGCPVDAPMTVSGVK